MKKEKTNEEILEEMVREIRNAKEEEDREEELIEILWDDVELMTDLSEVLNRISLYLRTYEMKRVDALKEDPNEL